MFGLFQRGPKAVIAQPVVPENLQMIPVRRSAFEASGNDRYGLIADVINYTDKMNGVGRSGVNQVLPLASQSYQAEFYRKQVDQSGHQQFIRSCGDTFEATAPQVLTGLRAMGALDHLEIFEDMMAIAGSFSSDGLLDHIAEELDVLDAEFRMLEGRHPMEGKNTDWIRSWLILLVVDDADYEDVTPKTLLPPVIFNLDADVPVLMGQPADACAIAINSK